MVHEGCDNGRKSSLLGFAALNRPDRDRRTLSHPFIRFACYPFLSATPLIGSQDGPRPRHPHHRKGACCSSRRAAAERPGSERTSTQGQGARALVTSGVGAIGLYMLIRWLVKSVEQSQPAPQPEVPIKAPIIT